MEETVELLDEYTAAYADYFPEARVRFKQLSYSQATYPIEVRLSGEDLDTLRSDAGKVLSILRNMPGTQLVQTDWNEPQAATKVMLKEDEAARLGINNVGIETTLAMRYGGGIPVASIWEGDYNMGIVLKNKKADNATNTDLANEQIAVAGGLGGSVPLRQVAELVPMWQNGQIVRRNGIYTVTVMSEVDRGKNVMLLAKDVQQQVANLHFSPDVKVEYGGELEENGENLPTIMSGLIVAAAIIFFILLIHFHRINIALLVFASISLCVLGAATGVLIHGLDFSMTCVLGLISLMGIIVRNGIIMIDYAEELRQTEKMSVRDAIYHSARRRMRPIFLTSAAASMGVIPMILGKSGLWMPMGTVICYGTLITMIFLLTVLPVCYWMVFRGTTRERIKIEKMEQQ